MPEAEDFAKSVHLPEHELMLVQSILKQVVPNRTVWAFGSRATGSRMLKRFSDLDLAVSGCLSLTERADLAEAFDESALPVKVDVVELDLVDPEFRERIERDFVPVQFADTKRSLPDPA